VNDTHRFLVGFALACGLAAPAVAVADAARGGDSK